MFWHLFAGLEGALLLFAIWVAFWLLDKLDTERRRNRSWQAECEWWHQHAAGRAWHVCDGEKERSGDAA